MEAVKSGEIQLLSQPHFIFRQEIPLLNSSTFFLLISSVSLCSLLSLFPWSTDSPAFSSTSHLCRVWMNKYFTSPIGVQFTGVPISTYFLSSVVLHKERGKKKKSAQPRLKASWELFVYLGWHWAQAKFPCSQKKVPLFSQGIVRTQPEILTQAVRNSTLNEQPTLQKCSSTLLSSFQVLAKPLSLQNFSLSSPPSFPWSKQTFAKSLSSILLYSL